MHIQSMHVQYTFILVQYGHALVDQYCTGCAITQAFLNLFIFVLHVLGMLAFICQRMLPSEEEVETLDSLVKGGMASKLALE